MRKVFLDDLPKKKYGNQERIDWRNSVGKKVDFIFDEIKGVVDIIESLGDDRLIIKYKDSMYDIKTYNFVKCGLKKVVGKKTREFKIEIGEFFEDEKRNLVIIDREYRNRADNQGNNKWYKFRCKKCCYEGWMVEGNILKGSGCACCSNPPKVIVLGINTVWDTAKWMCDLGVSEEDAKSYNKSSGKKIEVTCPDCGKKKKMSLNHIYTYKTISCVCNTKYSYPEQFMYSVLRQLNINFETQYSPKYISPKRSDFYLPCYNLVIEVDGGLGHRGGITHSKSDKTLKELIEIDKWKDEQHLKHGVKTIRINCFKSDMEYIKGSIIKSELSRIFDLSKINWIECENFALKNVVKEVCDYWNNKEEYETAKDLALAFNFDATTIRTYLKKGTELGWCVYNGYDEINKNNNRAGERNKKRCNKRVEIFKDNISLGIFESTSELERQSEVVFGLKLNHSKIGMVANNQRPHHKGYTFKYVD